MWYEFCLIKVRSIFQVDHFSGQSVTNKDKMFTKTFTPRKHQAAQYNTTEHLSPVPFLSLACAVCILVPFNRSSLLKLFLSAFTCPILPIACLDSMEKTGPARTHPERSQPCKNMRTFNNMHNSEQVKKKMHAGLNYPSTISISSILPSKPLERRRYSISPGLWPNSSLPTASTATASKPASMRPIF